MVETMLPCAIVLGDIKGGGLHVFKTKGVVKFARRERITDAVLREAIERQAIDEGELQEIDHDEQA